MCINTCTHTYSSIRTQFCRGRQVFFRITHIQLSLSFIITVLRFKVLRSVLITLSQVLLRFCLAQTSSTFIDKHFVLLSSFIYISYLYQSSLLSCTPSGSSLPQFSSLCICKCLCSCTLTVQWSILTSFLSTLPKSFTFNAHVLLPCSIVVLIQVPYILPFPLN